jgi:hypothetical protein
MDIHIRFGALLVVQVVPEFVEIKIGPLAISRPPAAAASLLPSAEEVMNNHLIFVNLFDVQVLPPSADVYIEPPESPAASLLPSAEEVSDTQLAKSPCGTFFDVQVSPEFVEV